MPDINQLNTKRYELTWMNYMRSLNLNNDNYDTIIGHGTSANAVIRYLESEKLLHKKVIFIDCADIYTAGERHGRNYLYSRIKDNCSYFRFIALTSQGANDAITLRNELDNGMYNLDPIIENYNDISINDNDMLIHKVINLINTSLMS